MRCVLATLIVLFAAVAHGADVTPVVVGTLDGKPLMIPERRIADGAYFCERWGRDIFIWTFDYLREGWRSTFGVFDNGTHISCAD